jgi:hypothetical protein
MPCLYYKETEAQRYMPDLQPSVTWQLKPQPLTTTLTSCSLSHHSQHLREHQISGEEMPFSEDSQLYLLTMSPVCVCVGHTFWVGRKTFHHFNSLLAFLAKVA